MIDPRELAEIVEAKNAEIEAEIGPQRCCACSAPITFSEMLRHGVCKACWDAACEAL
jgi:hypothetical protein